MHHRPALGFFILLVLLLPDAAVADMGDVYQARRSGTTRAIRALGWPSHDHSRYPSPRTNVRGVSAVRPAAAGDADAAGRVTNARRHGAGRHAEQPHPPVPHPAGLPERPAR